MRTVLFSNPSPAVELWILSYWSLEAPTFCPVQAATRPHSMYSLNHSKGESLVPSSILHFLSIRCSISHLFHAEIRICYNYEHGQNRKSEGDALRHGVVSSQHQLDPASYHALPQALGENLNLALL